MKKTFKIIKIISDKKVVVNAGHLDVKKNDQLEIYLIGEEVIDPETGEVLGTLDTIKAYLIVTDVYDKMCLCENATKNSTMSAFFDVAAQFSANLPRRLNVDSTQISGGLSEDIKIVIGDLVRRTIG